MPAWLEVNYCGIMDKPTLLRFGSPRISLGKYYWRAVPDFMIESVPGVRSASNMATDNNGLFHNHRAAL